VFLQVTSLRARNRTTHLVTKSLPKSGLREQNCGGSLNPVSATLQVKPSPQEGQVTLAVRPDGLSTVRGLFGIGNDKELALQMGIAPSSLCRVLQGQSAPGPRFIAAMLNTFGAEWFPALFAIVPTPDGAPEVKSA